MSIYMGENYYRNFEPVSRWCIVRRDLEAKCLTEMLFGKFQMPVIDFLHRRNEPQLQTKKRSEPDGDFGNK
jgi:hypothetical protein